MICIIVLQHIIVLPFVRLQRLEICLPFGTTAGQYNSLARNMVRNLEKRRILIYFLYCKKKIYQNERVTYISF